MKKMTLIALATLALMACNDGTANMNDANGVGNLTTENTSTNDAVPTESDVSPSTDKAFTNSN